MRQYYRKQSPEKDQPAVAVALMEFEGLSQSGLEKFMV